MDNAKQIKEVAKSHLGEKFVYHNDDGTGYNFPDYLTCHNAIQRPIDALNGVRLKMYCQWLTKICRKEFVNTAQATPWMKVWAYLHAINCWECE